MKTLFITCAFLAISTAAIAAPNDSRSGQPSDTGTSVDRLMENNVNRRGLPRKESDQPALSTDKKTVTKKVQETAPTEGEASTPAQ